VYEYTLSFLSQRRARHGAWVRGVHSRPCQLKQAEGVTKLIPTNENVSRADEEKREMSVRQLKQAEGVTKLIPTKEKVSRADEREIPVHNNIQEHHNRI
jgi:hypothetical protein